MSYLVALFAGAIQGFTEFLPISSSGHLVIIHELFPLELIDSLGFDVAVHVGTLLALIIYFYRDLAKYMAALFGSLRSWDYANNPDQRLAWLFAVSIIPAGLVGFFFEDIIDLYLRHLSVVAWTLLIGGVLFFVVEKISKQRRGLERVGFLTMLFIAFAQALALIPGVSRSGITITAGMFADMSRESAARFSFLMSVPIVFLAGAKKLYDLVKQGLDPQAIALYALGFAAAFVVGYVAIKYFLQFVRRYSLKVFGVYRIILAILIFIFLQ